MEKVRGLLINSDHSLDDIITMTGYINKSYFCTLFKKNHGITPNEYRKRNKQVSSTHPDCV